MAGLPVLRFVTWMSMSMQVDASTTNGAPLSLLAASRLIGSEVLVTKVRVALYVFVFLATSILESCYLQYQSLVSSVFIQHWSGEAFSLCIMFGTTLGLQYIDAQCFQGSHAVELVEQPIHSNVQHISTKMVGQTQ